MKCHSAAPVLIALAAAVLLTTAVSARGQHTTDDQHADHSHGDVVKARNFAEAVRRIADEVSAIEAALHAGSLSGVPDRANAVSALARELGALALNTASGVPRESVKEANLAGKDLARAAEALHEFADKGDLTGSAQAFAPVKVAAGRLEAIAPATYYCPMHCEGDKTYAAPGACPVCHMKLKKQTSERFTVDVRPIGGAVRAGAPVDLVFTIRDPRGMPVKEVEIVHEMPLHLLMVSEDLSWYAHEHPTLQPDGTFTFTWTFPAGGGYTLFHDFTPRDVGMQVVPVALEVEGAPAPAAALVVDSDTPRTIDGYTVALDTGGPVVVGGATRLTYTISKRGEPVTDLVPYLGAMGHLVIISQDLKEFVHSHPHESGAHGAGAHDVHGDHDQSGARKGGPTVEFEARFDAPGIYKGWAQFNHDGRILTVPFTFRVR